MVKIRAFPMWKMSDISFGYEVIISRNKFSELEGSSPLPRGGTSLLLHLHRGSDIYVPKYLPSYYRAEDALQSMTVWYLLAYRRIDITNNQNMTYYIEADLFYVFVRIVRFPYGIITWRSGISTQKSCRHSTVHRGCNIFLILKDSSPGYHVFAGFLGH